MLYTILPLDAVFPEEQSNNEYLSFENGLIEGEKIGENEYKIVRLISTDPAVYLKFSPEQIITL